MPPSEAPANPRFLLVETSGRVGQVALAEGPNVRAAHRLDEARRHARDLAPAVGQLLASLDWRPRDIDAVAVSRGPGSYTGLRVGIMSALTFAYATGCRLLAIDTFAALAEQVPLELKQFDVIADAQQGKVYLQRFERLSPTDPPRSLTGVRIVPVEAWLTEQPLPEGVSGPGLRLHQDRLPKGIAAVEEGLRDPRPESLLRIALRRYGAGEADDLWSVEPLYLRPSSAEEKWQARATP